MSPGMIVDALNRRNRFAGRQPTGKRIVLQERDFLYFAALERHGPLPATYLYEFSKSAAGNLKGHQQRLTDLYNEDNTPHHGFYLERPEQQFASLNARYQPLSYELTDVGIRALRDKGIERQSATPPSGPCLHRFMTACITASIELAVRQAGFRYITAADILRHPKCPANTRRAENPLALGIGNAVMVPDQLFGIDYGGRFRFFALEADRKTETIMTRKSNARAFGKKLDAYAEIVKREAYKDVWGIPTLFVLTVTTSLPHMRTMIDYVRDHAEPLVAQRFLFKTRPEFGKYWVVPPVMQDLMSEPWLRSRTPLNILHP
jgi:hypothetical protein